MPRQPGKFTRQHYDLQTLAFEQAINQNLPVDERRKWGKEWRDYESLRLAKARIPMQYRMQLEFQKRVMQLQGPDSKPIKAVSVIDVSTPEPASVPSVPSADGPVDGPKQGQ